MHDTVQQHQPEGVPPVELTGERTRPDVPAENYWFRRHLAVYEWVAERCAGLDVVDMACGEGYGVDVLARRARRVTGVDANPEAHEHARLKYSRPGVRFVRDLVESYDEPCDAVVFLQTIEHMPYVEGFGTWPFGEEWLWDALAGVYIPMLDALREAPVTLGLTPVLCDQLEALRGEAGDRFLDFMRTVRADIHAEDSRGLDEHGEPELAAEVRRAAGDYDTAAYTFERLHKDLLAELRELRRGGVE